MSTIPLCLNTSLVSQIWRALCTFFLLVADPRKPLRVSAGAPGFRLNQEVHSQGPVGRACQYSMVELFGTADGEELMYEPGMGRRSKTWGPYPAYQFC